MKFTLSWLKEHLDTDASAQQVVDAMTMAGLEVEHVDDPSAKLKAFTVAKIVEAVQHPNADRLRVCQVETIDGMKEIVCGAPNARAGITVVYAPIGAYVPGLGVTLVEKPVRGVVSNGMLCSESELETAEESDGILELPGDLTVGTPVAQALGLEAVIDFEVTPNRPDWLGVAGIARDMAAAGVGVLKDLAVAPIPGDFPSPIGIRIESPEACPVFAGRTIRAVRNGPSPEWLQQRLRSIGLRPINALVDVTNLISYDRARPLHVYDIAKLAGHSIVARLGHKDEHLIALDGKTYALDHEMCVIADAQGERPIGLGGVMGGESTGCDEATVDVFLESAWFDPIRTAQTGRVTGINSDAQYRFARGVDPGFVVSGIELATQLILHLCGGEPSEVIVAGEVPAPPKAVEFDPAYVEKLSGLALPESKIYGILEALGFERQGGMVQPPTWRRDVDGKADLVEEVARIVGFDALPTTALPEVPRPVGGVLTVRQARSRQARRALAAMGYAEAATWSFTARKTAELFGGGGDSLIVANPIAADLDCMRPSVLPNLIEAAQRNADRGFADVALFEIGPIYRGDGPSDQSIVASALIADRQGKRWDGRTSDALFDLKADLFSLLEALGAPVASLQIAQGVASPWFHPGRSAVIQLGPKARIAEFGELHPGVLKAMGAEGPMVGFELTIAAIPEPKKKATKTKPALDLSPLMPLTRDFAFVVDQAKPAGDLIRAVAGADKALIAGVRIFDLYQGAGVPEGMKSLAIEVQIQPREATLTEAEIEALSVKVVAAANKVGAKLRG